MYKANITQKSTEHKILYTDIIAEQEKIKKIKRFLLSIGIVSPTTPLAVSINYKTVPAEQREEERLRDRRKGRFRWPSTFLSFISLPASHLFIKVWDDLAH